MQSVREHEKKAVWLLIGLLGLLMVSWVFESALAGIFISKVQPECTLLYEVLIPYLISSLLSCLGILLGMLSAKMPSEHLYRVFKAVVLFAAGVRGMTVLLLIIKGTRVFGVCYFDSSFRVMLNLMNLASVGMLGSLYWIIEQAKKLQPT